MDSLHFHRVTLPLRGVLLMHRMLHGLGWTTLAAAIIALSSDGATAQQPRPNAKNKGKPHVVAAHTDYEVTPSDDVTVRLKYAPPKYDDKGKQVAYTKDELKDLKGPDPKLTGYTG